MKRDQRSTDRSRKRKQLDGEESIEGVVRCAPGQEGLTTASQENAVRFPDCFVRGVHALHDVIALDRESVSRRPWLVAGGRMYWGRNGQRVLKERNEDIVVIAVLLAHSGGRTFVSLRSVAQPTTSTHGGRGQSSSRMTRRASRFAVRGKSRVADKGVFEVVDIG